MEMASFSFLFQAVSVFILALGAGMMLFFVVFGLAWLRIATLAMRERRKMAEDPEGRMAYALTGRRPTRLRRPQAQQTGSALCPRCWQSPCVCDANDDEDTSPIAVRINGVWRRTRRGTLLDA